MGGTCPGGRRVRLLRFALPLVFAASFALGAAAKKDTAPAAKNKDIAADINAPRADARKVSLELHDGTWMSVDVSPDGQTIVFDLLGDVFTLPIAGGEARRIVGGMSFEAQPKFSP